MYSAAKIYRYLRFKDRFVSGRQLAKAIRFPLRRLYEVDDIPGTGGIGPCYRRGLKDRSAQFWNRYARHNGFCADFICFFKETAFGATGPNLRYWCIKNRPLRKGKSPPKIRKRK